MGDQIEEEIAGLIYVGLTPWKLAFDGSSTETTAGAGVIRTSPRGLNSGFAFQFDLECSNNPAEYEALIIGLDILLEMGARTIEVTGDSQLVFPQVAGE